MPRRNACAASIRSKGSRCGQSITPACSASAGSIPSAEAYHRRRCSPKSTTRGAAPGIFPIRTLVAISHADDADTHTIVSETARTSPAAGPRRDPSVSAQTRACVATRISTSALPGRELLVRPFVEEGARQLVVDEPHRASPGLLWHRDQASDRPTAPRDRDLRSLLHVTQQFGQSRLGVVNLHHPGCARRAGVP